MKNEYKIIKLNDREFENLKMIIMKELFNLRISYNEETDEIKKNEKDVKIKECNTLFTILSYVER